MKHKRGLSIWLLTSKMKHGYDVLAPFKGSPSYHLHNVLAGILGLGVGVAGLYMALRKGNMGISFLPWASEERDSPEIVYHVPGLQNLGNNCFLNVILQALANCSSFYPFLRNIMVGDDLLLDEKAEKIPLTVALISLLEDLCFIQDERIVLSPRKVMLAMGIYISSFNLTRQQDAAEALLHLLSSLQDEVLQLYVPHRSSLTDISALHSRISLSVEGGQSSCTQWQRLFIVPLHGTIGSILTCRSCSSVLSMDYEIFHCLPLSPLLGKSAHIADDCTLLDCIKHFTIAEHVENFRCSRCWHDAAHKFLSLKNEIEVITDLQEKMRVLGQCVNHNLCDCESLFLQEEITWAGFSDAIKQLRIVHCPQILCIQLQRAYMNPYGELIKLQTHISFPLLLDIFPFTEAAAGMQNITSYENMEKQCISLQHLKASQSVLPWEMQILPQVCKIFGENIVSETMLRNQMGSSICKSSGDDTVGTIQACCASDAAREPKAMETIKSGTTRKYLYTLSSVVEHYGRPGSGHYAVYRRVVPESISVDDPANQLKTSDCQWLYISDHEVSIVPEETVLASEASMLFYERNEAPS